MAAPQAVKIYRVKTGQREQSIAKREESLRKKIPAGQDNSVQIAFTFYVIAIAAKIAGIDVKERNIANEIASFKEIFSIPESEISKIEEYYNAALNDNISVVHYARQLTNLFPNNRILIEELIDDLFVFADADGPLSSKKVTILKEVTAALNFNENYFTRILRRNILVTDKDPFRLLGVSRDVTYVDLKKAYRKAVKDCHPDAIISKNLAEELRLIAQEQFNYYTEAYESVKIRRGFK